ncbi:hypothetical protein H9Q08_14940 [Chryseobacterium sp. PS-8]|uniref:Uncharacterized protein n=1 Tax=Chryseobacterium indicum TaxID=2766954 RepID=A0ABS9C8H8_9FLAO|nr:hypothetical protein [Chryseobacterium sp. PS-8]MCF2220583.1 hypothetical protein [Chryseobacterium sp. PS-8]
MKMLNIACLAIFLFSFGSLKSQNILKPENVFNLYFNSFVKYDDESVKELNSYLINFLGKESTHKMKLKDTYNEKIDEYTKLFLTGLPVNVASECSVEVKNYFSALMQNFANAKYRVKEIKIINDERLKGNGFSEVTYEVSFNVPSHNLMINMGDIKNIGAGEMKKYLIDVTNEIKKADKLVSTEQKFNLYQVKVGENIYYWNGGPQELNWKMNEFYLRNLN